MSRVYDALMRVVEGSKLQEEKLHVGTYPLPEVRNKIYEALTGAKEDSQPQEEKIKSVTFPLSKDTDSSTLLQDLEELEKILLSRISRMTSAAKQVELAATREVKDAQQTKEHLMARVTALETQLKEKDETLQAKDSVIVNLLSLKESLHAQIHDWANKAAEKEGLLQIRDTQIRNLKSKLEALVDRMGRMGSLLKQAEVLAAIDEDETEE